MPRRSRSVNIVTKGDPQCVNIKLRGRSPATPDADSRLLHGRGCEGSRHLGTRKLCPSTDQDRSPRRGHLSLDRVETIG